MLVQSMILDLTRPKPVLYITSPTDRKSMTKDMLSKHEKREEFEFESAEDVSHQMNGSA
jgi:hypothetical protein